MPRPLIAVLALAALSACGDGQPFFDDEGGGGGPIVDSPEDIAVTEEVAGNLVVVNYTPGANSITVEIDSLDTTPVLATYTRNAALDVDGYVAYSVQEDPLDRMFIAMVAESADEALRGALVQDGGVRNRFFGGAYFERSGTYTPHQPRQPDNGLVSYAGDYIGMLNGAAPRPGQILPVPPGTDPAIIPGQAIRVTGDVFINADFSDNTVEGSVYNRVADAPGLTMSSLALIVTTIDADGTFEGTSVEVDGRVLEDAGDWAGVFGGRGATSIAGGVRLIGDFIPEVQQEQEYGIFVLNLCGTPSDAAICDDVDP